MAEYNLHDSLNVYISQDAYVFEPSSTTGGGLYGNEKAIQETLTVDRRTGNMTINAANSGPPLVREKVITCFGIIGVISLATTDFILIITSRTPSCRLLSHPIYLANDFRLLPLSPSSTTATILDHPVEKELVSLVEQGLRAGKLWFSYGWDLTNSLQRQQEQVEQRLRLQGVQSAKLSQENSRKVDAMEGEPMWKRADDRFFWNKFLMSGMIEQTMRGGKENDLSRFILPVLFGSVELRSATINHRDFLFGLISRRSRYRAGTRYFTRGIDPTGHVANYNETEQIVLIDPMDESGLARGRVEGRERLSYVQVRGSVPLFWAEINNLRYKPDMQIMDIPETTAALKLHLDEQVRLYDEVWLVNLVNSKGHELPVKEAYERAVQMVGEPLAHYVYFDFHHECRKLRYDRISVLLDRMGEDIARMGYYHLTVDQPQQQQGRPSFPSSKQHGVVRSNCMDCLDRTNVVQAAMAKFALEKQLRAVGVLSLKESLNEQSDFISTFRHVWADHADVVSKAYSGTGALKTDYTRTGKRTKEGNIQDGINSVMRYVKNNFFDGVRQDAYDLLTGSWVARRGNIPPLSDVRPFSIRMMPYVFLFSAFMLFASAILPRGLYLPFKSYVWLWLMSSTLTAMYIWAQGVSYVAWPRLNPPYEILSYEGPGFRGPPLGRGIEVIPAFFQATKRARTQFQKVRPGRADEIEMGRKKRVD